MILCDVIGVLEKKWVERGWYFVTEEVTCLHTTYMGMSDD